MKKKIIALCLVVCLLAIAIAGGTLAYFTDYEQATNEYAIGSVEIDLYETTAHVDGVGNVVDEEAVDLGKGSDDATTYEYSNIMPGDTMTKIVTVENTGKSDAYIALTIKQDNYLNFNDHIDEYYENLDPSEVRALTGHPGNANYYMQLITDDIFSGTGWGLRYTKPTSDALRYMMINSQGTANGDVEVLGYGYTNVSSSSGKPVWNYAGDIFANVKSKTELEGNFHTLDGDYTRMWVIYLKVAPGASYTVDLTTTCPTYIDNFSGLAFDNMVLDVKAFAIQTAGFATPKDAFTELFKADDCFAY